MLVLVVPAPAALAHPLGNFTTNRFTGLEITPNEVRVHYVVDFAELAAFEERALMAGNDDEVDDKDLSEYAEALGDRLLA